VGAGWYPTSTGPFGLVNTARKVQIMARSNQQPPEGVDPVTGEVLPGTDVETVDAELDVQVSAGRKGDTGLSAYLQDESAYTEPDRTQAYRQIIDQILNADTPEDVLTPVEAVNASEHTERPFILYGFDVNQSEFDVGSPFYASMHVRFLDDDDPAVVNSGNQALMAQLIRLSQFENGFPRTVVIRKGKRPNRHGTFPLRLNMAIDPAQRAESGL
jgi:hypothetical protein